MKCSFHKDGWHRTFIMLDSHQDQDCIEHTCACWLPMTPSGKEKIPREFENCKGLWSWKDGQRKILEKT